MRSSEVVIWNEHLYRISNFRGMAWLSCVN